eukprot:CAMPEP_0167792858 /NCGR_PEP_ID=MMETSP0111_2-20121227/12805_1 /TAXON_ID=91324 /ORGANISM="Lotharella globosa, Strain CCCM811" /LENGTH=153 /DNA_ID=CAMNT_0007685845 /DNA_START=37 /DNA_END=499 /DNA_ORIENTATION=+
MSKTRAEASSTRSFLPPVCVVLEVLSPGASPPPLRPTATPNSCATARVLPFDPGRGGSSSSSSGSGPTGISSSSPSPAVAAVGVVLGSRVGRCDDDDDAADDCAAASVDESPPSFARVWQRDRQPTSLASRSMSGPMGVALAAPGIASLADHP